MSDPEEQKHEVSEGNQHDYEEEQEAEQSSTAGHAHRKKRAFKKAPDAPKRFKSAYICFVKDKMDDVKKSLPADVKVLPPRLNTEVFFSHLHVHHFTGHWSDEAAGLHVEKSPAARKAWIW